MLLKKKPLIVSKDNPFFGAISNRESFADTLEQMARSIDEPFVLAIDSPWGSGKTTFVQMWYHRLLNKKELPALYFNAWENDFVDDPVVPFIAELESLLKLEKVVHYNTASTFFDETKKLARDVLPIFFPKATSTAINAIGGTAGEIVSPIVEKILDDSINNYTKGKDSIESFRTSLEKFVKQISKNQNKNSNNDEVRPVIFFIDELDRCRPLYAIKLLERIKHLFNIRGIVFILVLDKTQLVHSIRNEYGIGMNAERYLSRFIDLDCQLPSPPLKEYVDNLVDQYDFPNFFNSYRNAVSGALDLTQFKEDLVEQAELFDVYLRDLEQCITSIAMFLRAADDRVNIDWPLLVFFVFLRRQNPETYNKYITKKITPDDVITYVRSLKNGIKVLNTDKGIALKALVTGANCTYEELKQLIESNRTLNNLGWEIADRQLGYLFQIYNVKRQPLAIVYNNLISVFRNKQR